MTVLVDVQNGRQEVVYLHLMAELHHQRLNGGLLFQLEPLHCVVQDKYLILLQLLRRVHPRQVHVGPVAQHQDILEPLRGWDELCPDGSPVAVHDHLVVFEEYVDGHILIHVCLLKMGGRVRVLSGSL